MRGNNRRRAWSDLPLELLSIIAKALISNPVDIHRFRSVCKSWHSSSPSPGPGCVLFPLPPKFSEISQYDIRLTLIYSLRSPHKSKRNWICFIDQFDKHKLSFRYTFSNNYRSLPKRLNMLDFHATELGRFYEITCDHLWKKKPSKLLLSLNNSAVLSLWPDGKLGLLFRQLNKQWEIIHDGKDFFLDDIIEFNGTFLAVDQSGSVYEISLGGAMHLNLIVPPIISYTCNAHPSTRRRFVESLGELYLVMPSTSDYGLTLTAVEVYRLTLELDVGLKKWVHVDDIGDRIFFLYPPYSYSASTHQLGATGDVCRSNCIVYQVDSFARYWGFLETDKSGRTWIGPSVYTIQVWHLEEAAHVTRKQSYDALFWPPPSWIR